MHMWLTLNPKVHKDVKGEINNSIILTDFNKAGSQFTSKQFPDKA